MGAQRIVLYSELALYPIHWDALTAIVADYDVSAVAYARPSADLPEVHRQLGWETDPVPGVDLRWIPEGSSWNRIRWLRRELRNIRPDAIWIQQEPTDLLTLELLFAARFERHPRIVCAVCENIFTSASTRVRIAGRLLWPRLDGLAAVASASIAGIRAIGLPDGVPAVPLVAGALPPPTDISPAPLPFELGPAPFVVGFAGQLTEQKGWKLLVAAVEELPGNVKLVLAGSGSSDPELHRRLATPALKGRVAHVGLLPRDDLWRFYAALDCLVLPAITTPTWMEQFGGVLADGMAAGLPLVGSTSGSIPEVIGPAGLVFPEGDVEALAGCLQRLADNPGLREELGREGHERFEHEFSIDAYADKLAALLGLDRRADPAVGQATATASA